MTIVTYLHGPQMLSAMFPDSELKDGAERLIRHLHASKIPMAVATSTHHHHFKLKTTKHRALFDLIPVVITGAVLMQQECSHIQDICMTRKHH